MRYRAENPGPESHFVPGTWYVFLYPDLLF